MDMNSSSPNSVMADEEIREATVEDYQNLLALETGGYEGLDYLPSTFQSLVQGPGVKGYVYLKGGQVVSFISTLTLDGGRTLLTSAGRLSKDHRGGGMYGRFKLKLAHVLGSSSPGVQQSAMTVSNVIMGSGLLRKYKVILEKDLTCMEMNVPGVKAAAAHLQRPQGLKMMTYDDVKTMMTSPSRHLFPEERIFIDWHPYRIMPDNLDLVTHGNDPVFVSDAKELEKIHDKGGNFPLKLISCSTNYHCQRGRNYDVVIFGTGSDEELLAHVQWHIFRLVDVAKEENAVMKMFYVRKLGDLVTEIVKQLPVTPVSFPFVKAIVLEKDGYPC